MNGQVEELKTVLNELTERGHLDSSENELVLSGYKDEFAKLDYRWYVLNEMADLSAYKLFQGMNFPYPGKGHRGASGLLMSSVGKPDDFFSDKEAQKRKVEKLSADLLELGLTTVSGEKEIMTSIGDAAVPEAGILMFYAYKVEELRQLPGKRKKQLERIERYQSEDLLSTGFMTSTAKDAPDFVEAFDLVPHFEFSEILNQNDVASDPVGGFTEIYERVLAKCPESGISILKISAREEELHGSKALWVSVSLAVGDAIVSDTLSYILLKDRKTGLRTPRTEFKNSIIDVVNKALIFKDVAYRLYYFTPGDVGSSHNGIGLAYLTRRQYLVIKEIDSQYFISGPHPEKSISPAVMEELLREGQKLGLLPNEIIVEEAKDTLKTMAELVTVYNIVEQNALFEKPKKYGNIVRQLGRLSKGAFNPTNVQETSSTDGEELTITFDVDGETQTITAINRRGSFYIDLLKSLGRFISGLNLEGGFYSMGIEANDVGVAYLTKEQEAWLAKNSSNMWVGKYIH